MDIEEVDEGAWDSTAKREAAVRRLIALPDGERTRKAFAFEAKRLRVSVATMFRLVAAWRSEPVRSTLLPARRGPKRGSPRMPLDKRAIIHTTIERFYPNARRRASRTWSTKLLRGASKQA